MLMSKRELQRRKWDLKKIEKQIELESKKNIRWIIAGAICLGLAVCITYLTK